MPSSQAGVTREETFRRIMLQARRIRLERPARVFRFKRTVYRPDWVDPARGVYYEVLGTRQRKWAIVAILDLMDLVYPTIQLIAVQPDGTPVQWGERRTRGYGAFERLSEIPGVLQRLGWTHRRFATYCGIHASTLSNIMTGTYAPSLTCREKVAAALDELANGCVHV